MSAFDTLAALVEAAPVKQKIITVDIIDLLEVLEELERFRTGGGKTGSKYTAEFEAAWAMYPARPGMSKAATFKAWTARLKAGATALAMIEGTQAYADYCRAEGTEAQFIKQPATFYGPGEHYAADWTPSKKRAAPLSVEEQNRINSAKAKEMLFGRREPGPQFMVPIGVDHARK